MMPIDNWSDDLSEDDCESNPFSNVLHNKLREEIETDIGVSKRRPFCITLTRGEPPKLAGGVSGLSHWKWLFVSHLWVEPRARGEGVGRELLERAERLARHRGCVGLYIDTFSTRARDFYLRAGFELSGSIPNFLPNANRYYLFKRIA